MRANRYCLHIEGLGYVRSVDAKNREVEFTDAKMSACPMGEREAYYFQRPLQVIYPDNKVKVHVYGSGRV